MRNVRHAGIVVRDLNRASAFYQELMRLSVVSQQDESGPFLDAILGVYGVQATTVKLAAKEGTTLVELLRFENHEERPPAEPNTTGPTHVAFTVDDLWADYDRLTRSGIEFTTEPQHSPDGNALVTFCRDPEGNLIELVEELR